MYSGRPRNWPFFEKKVNISLFDAILALKRAHCCVLVLCLVIGGVAGLVDNLLQPPGHGLDQRPHVGPVLHSNFAGTIIRENQRNGYTNRARDLKFSTNVYLDMGYNFYLKFDLTGGRLHSVITVFQTVLIASTFLKPEGEAASGSPHSISCQRNTIGLTGPIFSASLNEMHTEQ